jgi:hypothetical protein
LCIYCLSERLSCACVGRADHARGVAASSQNGMGQAHLEGVPLDRSTPRVLDNCNNLAPLSCYNTYLLPVRTAIEFVSFLEDTLRTRQLVSDCRSVWKRFASGNRGPGARGAQLDRAPHEHLLDARLGSPLSAPTPRSLAWLTATFQ